MDAPERPGPATDADAAPIVIADGDRTLHDELAPELVADGYAVERAPSVHALAAVLRSGPAALVILGDFGAPGGAAPLLRDMRAGSGGFAGLPTIDEPVIVLARAHTTLTMLRCFDAGADDFVARSAGYLQLRARVRAVLARADARPRERLRVGPLIVDRAASVASWRGCPLELTVTEFALLAHIARDPTRLYTKTELLRDVWAYRCLGRSRTVDAHACRLRRKLAQAGAQGLVVNRRGAGYVLAPVPAIRDPD